MTPYPDNLTASALFEIIKDVPREAWPDDIRYNPEIPHADGTIQNEGGSLSLASKQGNWYDSPIAVATAAHAFNGAMAAWLAGRFYQISCNDDATEYCVWLSDEEGLKEYNYPTLIEALAQACKETK